MNSLELAAPEAIIGRKRILHQDFAMQRGGYSRRYGLVAVELPVRIVRGVEQHGIGTQMIDHPFHLIGLGRRVERLDGEADMVANDLVGRAIDPRHLRSGRRARTSQTARECREARSRPIPKTTFSPGTWRTPFGTRLVTCALKALRLARIILDVVVGQPSDVTEWR